MNPNILYSLSYGMYAIGTKENSKPSASIVNTIFQVTASPVLVAVSVNHDNYTNECIKRDGMFSVSVLSENTPGTVIGALGFSSGRDVDKLENVKYRVLEEGLPVIEEKCCCWFLCKVVNSIETPTHTVFLAEVLNGSEESVGVPMTYSYYHNVIKGRAPKNAPTYQEFAKKFGSFDSYICKLCGYVYNSSNKSFEDLPDEWVCPICGAPKSIFQPKR